MDLITSIFDLLIGVGIIYVLVKIWQGFFRWFFPDD